MRRFLAAGFIIILGFGLMLCGQDSSNLYDRMGIITERGLHGAVPEENIDLFSGSLVLKNLDITLPGPNGFDLNIWRVYNSKVNMDCTFGNVTYPQQESLSWVGYGWMMHMGRLLNPDSANPAIQFPDGRTENTYKWIHDIFGSTLITRNFLQLKKNNPNYGHHTVHFQDGTVWVFGARSFIYLEGSTVTVDLVTKIVNSYGHEINIEYYSGTTKLKQITDALGRVVTFVLDDQGNLDYIRVPRGGLNGYVDYDYTVSQGWGDPTYTKLDRLKPPVLDAVSYDYSGSLTKELHQVTTSYGGTITYTFDKWEFIYKDDFLVTRVVTSKTIQFADEKTATWNYFYGDNEHTIYYIDVPVDNQTKRLTANYSTVTGPESFEEFWFFGPQTESEWYWISGTLAIKDTTLVDNHTVVIANNWYNKEPEQISTEHVIVKSNDWGPAKASLESDILLTKIGTASQYTQILYDNVEARKYGLPSGIKVASPYNINPAGQQNSLQLAKVKSQPLIKVLGLRGTTAAQNKNNINQSSENTYYVKYIKEYDYAFLHTTENNFKDRYMLSFLSMERFYDQEGTLKDTKWDYFPNGAIEKIRRWRGGGEVLTWDYTYHESGVAYPSTITITINPPGDKSGIETYIYKHGTLARVEKPGYVELDRDIYDDGQIFSETNQHGGTMTFSYDDIGRITHIDMPNGFNYINATWEQNNVRITRGSGNFYSLTKYWDGMGRNLGFEERGFQICLYSRRELDGEGRVIAESKEALYESNKTVFEFNDNGQPLQVTDPTGKWTKFAYEDNTCTITDMNYNHKILTYAHLPGLVTSVVQENTRTDSYYQGENRLYFVESTAPSQTARYQTYGQNGLDQLTYEYHPETNRIGYLYNDEGNLREKKWSDDTAMTYTYNTANQLLSETDGDETISFDYDTHGRVKEVGTNTNLWRRYDITYNALGAVTSEKQALNGIGTDKMVTYGYNANGLLDELTYPDGRKAAYGYSSQLLPVSLAFNNDLKCISDVYYGANKQPTDYKLANGAVFSASYDAAGRIENSKLRKVTNTLFNATYGYDNVGNITSLNRNKPPGGPVANIASLTRTKPAGAVNVGNIASLTSTKPTGEAIFTYDAFNRLTKATYPEKIFDYSYDPFGNMLTVEENNVKVFDKTYTVYNQISGFNYLRGNLTEGDGLSQVWDKRNRMRESRITTTNFLLGSYVYNERGLRLKAERFTPQSTVQVVRPNGGEGLYFGALDTINWSSMGVSGYLKLELLVNDIVVGVIADNVPAAQTSYLWPVGKTLTGWANPGSNLKVRVSAVVPPSPPSTTYYFYDSSGRLLSEYDQSGVCVKDYLYLGSKMVGEFQPAGSKYYYYTSDQINSTRLVTDATGAVVHSAQYDPYGGLYKTWVDTWHPKPGFSGKEREGGSEMDYFGARYYGHRQYRFLSVDPVINKDESLTNSQLWNLYSYCRNNPLTFIDPDGREDGSAISDAIAHSLWMELYGEETALKMIESENMGRMIAAAVGVGTLAIGVAFESIIPLIGPAEKAIEEFENFVYQSINSAGEVQYVGITNNLARRAVEQLASKGIEIEQIMSGLSRSSARAVEQALIEIYGLGNLGGTLLNKINSISIANPNYAELLQEGLDLLQKMGY